MPDAEPETWQPIPAPERRVLGVLIEKQKTAKTHEAYPMTINSLVAGCNQKSARDPLTEYDEVDVENALFTLQSRGMITKMTGTRTDRYRHLLYELWKVDSEELALLAELLLRGAQTLGELRQRASRMAEIKDAEQVRSLVNRLVARNLAVALAPLDNRGAMVTHGFLGESELAAVRRNPVSAAREVEISPSLSSALEARVAALEAQVAELRRLVSERGA